MPKKTEKKKIGGQNDRKRERSSSQSQSQNMTKQPKYEGPIPTFVKLTNPSKLSSIDYPYPQGPIPTFVKLQKTKKTPPPLLQIPIPPSKESEDVSRSYKPSSDLRYDEKKMLSQNARDDVKEANFQLQRARYLAKDDMTENRMKRLENADKYIIEANNHVMMSKDMEELPEVKKAIATAMRKVGKANEISRAILNEMEKSVIQRERKSVKAYNPEKEAKRPQWASTKK